MGRNKSYRGNLKNLHTGSRSTDERDGKSRTAGKDGTRSKKHVAPSCATLDSSDCTYALAGNIRYTQSILAINPDTIISKMGQHTITGRPSHDVKVAVCCLCKEGLALLSIVAVFATGQEPLYLHSSHRASKYSATGLRNRICL